MNIHEPTFKKGDHICFGWGNNTIFEVKLKPRFKGRIEYVTIEMDGRRRECLAQSFRWALPAEVEKQHRINDGEELKRLGGATALIQLFGAKAVQNAANSGSDVAFQWDGVEFTQNEAVEALEAYKNELIEKFKKALA